MRKVLLLACSLLATLAAQADGGVRQTVTIGGQTVAGTVTKITFDGDNAVLTFADNTTRTAAPEQVNISFIYDVTAIERVAASDVAKGPVYTLQGQYVGQDVTHLAKGVYIVEGKKFIVK